jgi:hypothetical protein
MLLLGGLVACGSSEKSTSGTDQTAGAMPTTSESSGESATAGGDAAPSAAIPEPIEPGSEYSATTILSCGFGGAAPGQYCNAGVKRNWGDKGDEALVEVFKPDGAKRAIFFRGTEPYGADGNEADGSVAWDFKAVRAGDQVTIKYGPETYIIIDSLILGG